MLTPFSGLSLIIHLVVIGLAKISRIGRKKTTAYKALRTPSVSRRRFNVAFSIGIMLAISSAMLFSFAIALSTSIRESGHEWHVQFAKKEWQELRDVNFGVLEYVAAQGDAWQTLTISK